MGDLDIEYIFNEHLDPDVNYFDQISRNLMNNQHSNYISVDDYNHSRNISKNFNIISYNIRSYHANADSFLSIFNDNKCFPEILCLSETCFKENTCQDLIGYDSFHVTRSDRRSGGVSVYVQEIYSAECVSQLSFSNETIEICTIKVKIESNIYFVLAVYRPHSDNIENFMLAFETILQSDLLRNKKCIICGDFNINLLNNSQIVNIFMNNMFSNHFLPLISKPTRFPNVNGQEPSLLDHFWINSLDMTYSSHILLNDMTDHCPIILDIPLNSPQHIRNNETIQIQFRCKNMANKIKFDTELQNFNWLTIKNNNPNDYLDSFVSTINSIYCRCFPIKTKCISGISYQKPWVDNDVKRLLSVKSQYFKLLQLGLITKNENNAFKNRIKKILSNKKKSFLFSYFNQNRKNLNNTWKMIRMISCKNLNSKCIK